MVDNTNGAEAENVGSDYKEEKANIDNNDGNNGAGYSANNNESATNGGKPSAPVDPEPFRKLFVGGLSLNTTDDGLKNFYAQFGEILDSVVMKDSQTKKSRGFGFVSFTSKEEVDRAMAARPHEIDGKTVDPKRAVPRDQSARSESNISTKRLYVSGIREGHTEDSLKDHFVQFGNVEKVEIINDKVTQKPRGFAFITFDDHDAVDKCVLQKSHMIDGFRCDVKKALSREDMARAQQMDRDRMERGARSRGMQRGAPGAAWGGGGGGGRGYGFNGGSGGGAWGGQGAGGWGAQQGQWGPSGGGYGGGYGGYGGGGGATGGGGAWGGGGAGGWGADTAASWGPAAPTGGGAPAPQQWGGGPPARY